MRSSERVDYKTKLSELIGLLRKENLVATDEPMSPWCGSDNLSDEWLASNHDHWAKDIDFEVRYRRQAGQNSKFLVGWHNVEVFSIVPWHGE